MTSALIRSGVVLASGVLALLVSGCSSAEQPEVERVAAQFEDSSGDAEARCGLLMPRTLEQLEEESEASCTEAIQDLPLQGGEVSRVEVWGGDALVEVGGDTLFLTKAADGWRVAAAVCSPQPEGPYDCEVEGS